MYITSYTWLRTVVPESVYELKYSLSKMMI